MVEKTGNKWSTEKCGLCGKSHYRCKGRLTAMGAEYVICGRTRKRVYLSDCAKYNNPYGVWTKEIKYIDYVNEQLSKLDEYEHKLFEDVVSGLQTIGWRRDLQGQTRARLSKNDSTIKVFRSVERPDVIQIRFSAPPEKE